MCEKDARKLSINILEPFVLWAACIRILESSSNVEITFSVSIEWTKLYLLSFEGVSYSPCKMLK